MLWIIYYQGLMGLILSRMSRTDNRIVKNNSQWDDKKDNIHKKEENGKIRVGKEEV